MSDTLTLTKIPSNTMEKTATHSPEKHGTGDLCETPPTDPSPTAATEPNPSLANPDLTESEEAGPNTPIEALERDHPSFEKATISLIIQLLPQDEHPDGRVVLLAVKSHNLTPKATTVRLNAITPLPAPLLRLLEQWKESLPNALLARSTQRAQAKAKAEQEERDRKAKAEAAKQRQKDDKKSSRTTTKPKTTPPGPSTTTSSNRTSAETSTAEHAPASTAPLTTEQAALF